MTESDPDDLDLADTDRDDDDEDRAPTCSCCEPREAARSPAAGAAGEHWHPDDGMLDTALPDSLQSSLESFAGDESIETLRDWAAVVRERTGGGAIAVDDLCETTEPTPHWADVDGDRRHYACFYDAVVLAALTDRTIDVRTESPDGTVVEAHATPDGEITVTPPTTVVSFGIDPDAAATADGDPTPADAYAAICPYVRAFPTRAAYADWDATVDADTVALPLADAAALATALAA